MHRVLRLRRRVRGDLRAVIAPSQWSARQRVVDSVALPATSHLHNAVQMRALSVANAFQNHGLLRQHTRLMSSSTAADGNAALVRFPPMCSLLLPTVRITNTLMTCYVLMDLLDAGNARAGVASDVQCDAE